MTIDIGRIADILIGLFVGSSVVAFWLRKRITLSIDEKIKRLQNERETINQFLEMWYTRRHDSSDEWLKSFSKAGKDMILWCPNDVLYHLGMYLSLFGKPEAEIHFGKAVLCFRKTLGYKNHWWQRRKVSAKHIILLYSVGNPEAIK